MGFSPVSGRVFMRFPDEHEGLVAQPMQALDTAPTAAALQGIEAFVLVRASGCISFGRRRDTSDSIEWSGEIGTECLPSTTVECFASLTFQVDKLEAPTQISITWAGDLPPASMELDGSLQDFNAAWSVHEYEW